MMTGGAPRIFHQQRRRGFIVGGELYSLSELIVHCLISGGSYKCNVEC